MLDHERLVAEVAQTELLAEEPSGAHFSEIEGRRVDSDAGTVRLFSEARPSESETQAGEREEAPHGVPLAARPRGFFFESVRRRM